VKVEETAAQDIHGQEPEAPMQEVEGGQFLHLEDIMSVPTHRGRQDLLVKAVLEAEEMDQTKRHSLTIHIQEPRNLEELTLVAVQEARKTLILLVALEVLEL
jgi:hypothetical protein